jgi:hypothetical protein
MHGVYSRQFLLALCVGGILQFHTSCSETSGHRVCCCRHDCYGYSSKAHVCPASYMFPGLFFTRMTLAVAFQEQHCYGIARQCVLCAECIGSKLCCWLVRLTWHTSLLPGPNSSFTPCVHASCTGASLLVRYSVRPCYLFMHLGWGSGDSAIIAKSCSACAARRACLTAAGCQLVKLALGTAVRAGCAVCAALHSCGWCW